jgi:hypothetical protein
MGVLTRWTAPLRRPRFWLILLGLVVVIRLALPYALRPIIESQASKALSARVSVGDVDLALLRGAVALEDVAVRTGPAPEPSTPPADDQTPIVAWKRFAVNVGWLALFQKTIRLEEVELDDPKVALDRLANGEINLLALVPKTKEPAEKPPEDATPPAPSTWGIAIDHFVLRQGGLRFRDLMVGGGAEPIDIDLAAIDVQEIALQPGTYGEPARLHFDVAVDQGLLRVDSRLRLRQDGGFDVDTDLKARRLPLKRSRVYVPDVGWTNLSGTVGFSMRHHLETGKSNELRGGAVVDDLTVLVGGLEEPALAWKRLVVTLNPLDLQAQRAVVSSVDLGGMSMVARLAGGDPLPVLVLAHREGVLVKDDGSAPPSGEPPKDAEPAKPDHAEPKAPAKPWRWSVGSVHVHDSVVDVYGHTPAPMQVAVDVGVRRLAGEGEHTAPVDVSLKVGVATLDLDGEALVKPPGFKGKLAIANLALPELVTFVGALPPSLLQRGSLTLNLDVAAGSQASPAGDVTVAGTLAFGDPWMAKDDGKEFGVGAKTIEIGVEEVRLPGIMATPPVKAPVQVKLSALTVVAPNVQMTRTPDGMVLPAFTAEASPPITKATTKATTKTRTTTNRPPSTAAAATTGTTTPPPANVSIGTLALTDGRVRVTDRTVKPFWSGDFKPFVFSAKDVRWPDLAMQNLSLKATSTSKGTIDVTGSVSPDGGKFEVKTRDLALMPFNPFATTYSPYSIARGKLTVTTKGSFGKGKYDTTTALTLSNFDLGGKEGDSLFSQQFGIPLTTALALMRDLKGDIKFDIPVKVDETGTTVPIGSIVAQALRAALLGALTSPLKLIGAAFGGGDGEGPGPIGIEFPIGRAELTSDANANVDKLADFMASRPGVGITLSATLTPKDVRWLREQSLAAELAAPQGVFGAIRNLPARGARDRIRTALEARARDEEGKLDDEDAKTLEEWLTERGDLPKDKAKALADARIAAVQKALVEGKGVDATRVKPGEPPADDASKEKEEQPADAPPVVAIGLGAAG